MTLKGSFFFRYNTAINGTLILTHASIGSLVDEVSAWPDDGMLELDGFTYESIGGPTTPTDAKSRLEWLNLQSDEDLTYDFKPQPYEQLAKALRQMGHTTDARLVNIAKQQQLRESKTLCSKKKMIEHKEKEKFLCNERKSLFETQINQIKAPNTAIKKNNQITPLWNNLQQWVKLKSNTLKHQVKIKAIGIVFLFSRSKHSVKFVTHQLLSFLGIWAKHIWSLILEHTIGFGYAPWRVIKWLIAFFVIGSATFYVANDNNIMVPSDSRVYMTNSKKIPDKYPKFSPLTYSLDTLIPLVGLHQEKYWEPDATTGWGTLTRFYLWFQILAGWMLATLGVAGMTGIVKRD